MPKYDNKEVYISNSTGNVLTIINSYGSSICDDDPEACAVEMFLAYLFTSEGVLIGFANYLTRAGDYRIETLIEHQMYDEYYRNMELYGNYDAWYSFMQDYVNGNCEWLAQNDQFCENVDAWLGMDYVNDPCLSAMDIISNDAIDSFAGRTGHEYSFVSWYSPSQYNYTH